MLHKVAVEKQLYHIHLQRNKPVWIFHVLLIIVSTFFQRGEPQKSHLWWISIVVFGLGLVLRFLFLHVFFEQWKLKNPWSSFLNYAGLIVLGGGWYLHFLSIFLAYGPHSAQASNILIILAGLMTGASISAASHKNSFYAFSGTITLSLLFTYLCTPASDKSEALYVMLFFAFNLYNLILSHNQLVRSIAAEIKAESEKDRISSIINTVPGYISVFDNNLVCTLANKATLDNYPDIVGKKVGSFEKDSDWEKFLHDFSTSDQKAIMCESHVRRWGRDLWMLRNAQKTEQGIIFVSADISELVISRNKIRDQEAHSLYTAKLASLGEMAAGIAHEINNPLTVIQGSASIIGRLIEKEPMDRPSIKMLTEKLVNTSQRISKTIRSLKALSRNGDDDPFEEIDLGKLLDQCKDIVQMRCERKELTLKLPVLTEAVKFVGREVQIYQVLMNLISNAIDAVKDTPNPWIEVAYVYGPDALDLYVSDSGPGVPEAIRNKIMDPFFTTKDVNHGTGLGLSISKSILAGHKGELTLMEGTHTTFCIHLPTLRD